MDSVFYWNGLCDGCFTDINSIDKNWCPGTIGFRKDIADLVIQDVAIRMYRSREQSREKSKKYQTLFHEISYEKQMGENELNIYKSIFLILQC